VNIQSLPILTSGHQERNLNRFFRFLATPVPWQYLYRRIFHNHPSIYPRESWAITTATTENFDPFTFRPEEMTQIPSSPGVTRADPFLWSRDGTHYLFMEDWPAGDPCAHISAMELDDHGKQRGSPVPIISSKTHFSYPYVFEYDGQLWMLPEYSSSNRLQLFRCVEFPHHWVADRILMEGTSYADPTVFEHDGVWWMFISLKTGFCGLTSNLFLFHADNPISSEWIPHPMNPVVSGFHQSRPAGRPFVANGRLFRPAQNCLKRYGHFVVFNEITRLDVHRYAERSVRKIMPWAEHILAVHHFDICGNRAAMDIQLRNPADSAADATEETNMV